MGRKLTMSYQYTLEAKESYWAALGKSTHRGRDPSLLSPMKCIKHSVQAPTWIYWGKSSKGCQGQLKNWRILLTRIILTPEIKAGKKRLWGTYYPCVKIAITR